LKIIIGLLGIFVLMAGCIGTATPQTTTGSDPSPVQVTMPQERSFIGSWYLNYSGVKGTVSFLSSGLTDIEINGYPGTSLKWVNIGVNTYQISYLWRVVNFNYNPDSDTITSPDYPGAIMERA
jgi:hypothetical protein